MNTILSFTPALLGVVVVLQAGLNKKISAQWSLSAAVLLNALVFAAVAGSVFVFQSMGEQKPTVDFKTFSWWYLVPGVLGCILVFGGPWSIARWGAVNTFILIISAQLFTSLIWDIQIEGLAVSKMRLAGIALAWVGALMVCKA